MKILEMYYDSIWIRFLFDLINRSRRSLRQRFDARQLRLRHWLSFSIRSKSAGVAPFGTASFSAASPT